MAVQAQRESVTLWALVDPSKDVEDRKIHTMVTGARVPSDGLEYLGTVQLAGGSFVVHVFEEK